MEDMYSLLPKAIMDKQAIADILDCNAYSAQFGLTLTTAEAFALIQTRAAALQSNGRVEFGGGIIDKLIRAFSHSPYIGVHHYAETMHQLIETFYYFKNESLEVIGDDELITLMKTYFDDNCRGSVELLQSRELEAMAHNIRFARTDYANVRDENHRGEVE